MALSTPQIPSSWNPDTNLIETIMSTTSAEYIHLQHPESKTLYGGNTHSEPLTSVDAQEEPEDGHDRHHGSACVSMDRNGAPEEKSTSLSPLNQGKGDIGRRRSILKTLSHTGILSSPSISPSAETNRRVQLESALTASEIFDRQDALFLEGNELADIQNVSRPVTASSKTPDIVIKAAIYKKFFIFREMRYELDARVFTEETTMKGWLMVSSQTHQQYTQPKARFCYSWGGHIWVCKDPQVKYALLLIPLYSIVIMPTKSSRNVYAFLVQSLDSQRAWCLKAYDSNTKRAWMADVLANIKKYLVLVPYIPEEQHCSATPPCDPLRSASRVDIFDTPRAANTFESLQSQSRIAFLQYQGSHSEVPALDEADLKSSSDEFVDVMPVPSAQALQETATEATLAHPEVMQEVAKPEEEATESAHSERPQTSPVHSPSRPLKGLTASLRAASMLRSFHDEQAQSMDQILASTKQGSTSSLVHHSVLNTLAGQLSRKLTSSRQFDQEEMTPSEDGSHQIVVFPKAHLLPPSSPLSHPQIHVAKHATAPRRTSNSITTYRMSSEQDVELQSSSITATNQSLSDSDSQRSGHLGNAIAKIARSHSQTKVWMRALDGTHPEAASARFSSIALEGIQSGGSKASLDSILTSSMLAVRINSSNRS